jgi:hypothetical protein
MNVSYSGTPKGLPWFSNSIESEFPWLSDEMKNNLNLIAEGKQIVPNDELDSEFHALCLCTKVYLRIASLMFESVGTIFYHRPACSIGDDTGNGKKTQDGIVSHSILYSPALSIEENLEYKRLYEAMIPEMYKLTGMGKVLSTRKQPVGIYTRDSIVV